MRRKLARIVLRPFLVVLLVCPLAILIGMRSALATTCTALPGEGGVVTDCWVFNTCNNGTEICIHFDCFGDPTNGCFQNSGQECEVNGCTDYQQCGPCVK